MKERLKKPGEDVTDQWADRNSNESVSLIKNDTNAEEAEDTGVMEKEEAGQSHN